MGVLRSDRVSGLGGANAINGSAHFQGGDGLNAGTAWNRHIDAGISEDYNFGTGDFTVECWINRKVVTNDDTIWGTTLAEASTGFMWYFDSSGNLRAYVGGSQKSSTSNSISAGTWYHVAITRASGTMQMWVDGVSKYSATVSGTVGSSTQNFIIGNSVLSYGTNAYHFLGHISNLRIQKGKAEYTSAFTPPTTRLKVTPETVLLACHDPGNVLAEATGKTLNLVKNDLNLGGKSAGIVASRFAPDVGEDYGTTFEDNTKFDTLSYMVPPGGITTQRGRGRGAFAMTAAYPNTNNSISYIDIASQGIAKDFGDLTAAGRYGCGNSSATRGVSGGALGRLTTMDYFTLATTGNAISFGTLTYNNWAQASVANSTRLIWISGNNPGSSPESNINTMTYITIATTGNGTDFGDYTDGEKARYIGGNISSPTRGLAFGGFHDPNYTSNIDYVTIATTGDGQDFGDLSEPKSGCPGCSDSTRGVIFGGYTAPASVNVIDMVTIATTGSTADFGDISATTEYGAACSNSIRGVHLPGGYPGTDNSMAYVTIQSAGNAFDFGDLPTGETGGDSCANNNFADSHGGIS